MCACCLHNLYPLHCTVLHTIIRALNRCIACTFSILFHLSLKHAYCAASDRVRQVEHRNVSLVVKYAKHLAGHRASSKARGEMGCHLPKVKLYQCSSEARMSPLRVEKAYFDNRGRSSCMLWARSTVKVQRLITAASHMCKRLELVDNSTNCSSCM